MEALERLTRRWQRERKARKEAESLLEERSRAFFNLNEELVQLAAQISEKEEWSRSILEAVVNGIITVDEQGLIQFTNRSAQTMFGYPQQEIAGQALQALIPTQMDSRFALETLPVGMAHPHGEAVETIGVRRDGSSFPVELTVSMTHPGGQKLFILVVSDISERNRTKEALAHKTGQLQLILETVGEGIFGVDEIGCFSFVNPAASQMLGWNQAQLIGSNSHQLIHHTKPDGSLHSREECPIYASFRKGQEQKILQDIFWCKDGSSIPVEYTSRPIQEDGKAVGVVVSFRDISERIEGEAKRQMMEIQLRQAQKLEAVGQLAAGIAHEINTPTQFVTDNTHFLKEAFADYGRLLKRYAQLTALVTTQPVAQELLVEVKTVVKEIDLEYLQQEVPLAIGQTLDGLGRIAMIVKAMKEFSHPGSAEKALSDLNRAIQTTIDVSRNEWKYNADLVADLDPALPQVPVLLGEFNQVMLNLIVNASHAIAGVLDNERAKGLIRISTRVVGDCVEIEVSDNGAGIPEDIKGRIFDPFFTTKEVGKGSGQGLAIAWSLIVDKHGGSLVVDSEEGEGATFTIRLPYMQKTRVQVKC